MFVNVKVCVSVKDNLIYDIFRTDSAGNKYRDLEGEIEVIERITD